MKKAAIRRVFALVLTWMMLVPNIAPSVLMESFDLNNELQIDLGGEELELPSDDLVLDGIGDLSLDLDDLTLSSNDSSPEPLPFEQTVTFEDVTVRVTARAGAMPDGSSCRISDVIQDEGANAAREAVEVALPGKALKHHLYHIELLDRDGNPVLPSNGLPLVSIAGLDITGEIRVFAYGKNGSYETDGWMADRKIEFNLSESAIIDIVDVTGEKTVEQEPTDEQHGVDERQPADEQQPADELPVVDDVPQVTDDVLSVDDVEIEQDVQSEDEQQPQQPGDEGQDVDEQQPTDDEQQGVDDQQGVDGQQSVDEQ